MGPHCGKIKESGQKVFVFTLYGEPKDKKQTCRKSLADSTIKYLGKVWLAWPWPECYTV